MPNTEPLTLTASTGLVAALLARASVLAERADPEAVDLLLRLRAAELAAAALAGDIAAAEPGPGWDHPDVQLASTHHGAVAAALEIASGWDLAAFGDQAPLATRLLLNLSDLTRRSD